MASVKHQDDHTRVYNFDNHKPRLKKLRKKALLSYLVQPVVDLTNGQEFNRFSNAGLAVSWPQVLNQLGYKVDIINWDDKDFAPEYEYDLVVFHGGKNFGKIYPQLTGEPRIIYFSTGMHWRYHNAQEGKRFNEFEKRRKIHIAHDRFINEPEESAYQAADGLIILGNDVTRETYAHYRPVVAVNNANFPDSHFDKVKKEYSVARNNWLFFAGAGNIHKGLDLVIEVFAQLNQNLFIITLPEKEFTRAYKKELELPNIHFLGEVAMRTEHFYEIADKCAFQIFPSCSEGQPGSVIEAMNQGLIPIVSSQSGLDARGYGVVLRENTIDCIKEAVTRMSSLEADEVEKMAIKTRKVAMRDHNPEKFRKDLKKAIKTILKSA